MQIIETDGKSSFFVVPYAAVPGSMRPGNMSYQLAAGKVRNYYSVQNAFAEGVLQYGVNNRFTANTGTRFANNYQALLAGGVFASELGALSLNTTWSHARVENNQSKAAGAPRRHTAKPSRATPILCWQPTAIPPPDTAISGDVLGVRRQQQNRANYYSDTLKQRNRFTATLSQNMDEYGTLSLSGSSTDYYNNRSRITELQLSYNNIWKKLSYNINVGRQRSSWSNTNYIYSVNDAEYDSSRYQKYTENVVSIGFSIPLDWRDSRSSVSFDMTKNKIPARR